MKTGAERYQLLNYLQTIRWNDIIMLSVCEKIECECEHVIKSEYELSVE